MSTSTYRSLRILIIYSRQRGFGGTKKQIETLAIYKPQPPRPCQLGKPGLFTACQQQAAGSTGFEIFWGNKGQLPSLAVWNLPSLQPTVRPWKLGHPQKERIVFQASNFRCYVGFRGCMWSTDRCKLIWSPWKIETLSFPSNITHYQKGWCWTTNNVPPLLFDLILQVSRLYTSIFQRVLFEPL